MEPTSLQSKQSAHRFERPPQEAPFREVCTRTAQMAHQLFDVPAVLVGFEEPSGEWKWISSGLELETSVASFVLRQQNLFSGMLVVEDTYADMRWMHHPLVTGEPAIRFLVATTLQSAFETNGGVLVLLDTRPRRFVGKDRELFTHLAALLTDALEGRRAAWRQGEDLNRLKRTLLDNMSHEIRTPLTSIMGFADVLVGEVDDSLREFAQLIRKNGERLMTTLNHVLDLAQLEGQALQLSLQPTNLTALVAHVVAQLRGQALEKNLDLAVDAPGPAIWVIADDGALRRVLTHLVSNAIKFTNSGQVTIGIGVQQEHALLQVADTGVGIQPGFLPRLFNEFEQESVGLSRGFEGSGLGLTITKRLVDLMGGAITVESAKDFGTAFTVQLPCVPPETRSIARSERPPVADPVRVLFVEDNPYTRLLVKRILPADFELTAAATGETALELARRATYDILLLDISLGAGLSGVELLERLRRIPGYESAPVIAVTAHSMPGDRKSFLAQGFDGYLAKPFERRQLLRVLETARLLSARVNEPARESLETLLVTCLQNGLIDRYQEERDGIVFEQEGAFFQVSYPAAERALSAMLYQA